MAVFNIQLTLQRIICLYQRCTLVINDAAPAGSASKNDYMSLIENDYFLLWFCQWILTVQFNPYSPSFWPSNGFLYPAAVSLTSSWKDTLFVGSSRRCGCDHSSGVRDCCTSLWMPVNPQRHRREEPKFVTSARRKYKYPFCEQPALTPCPLLTEPLLYWVSSLLYILLYDQIGKLEYSWTADRALPLLYKHT